VYAVIYERTIIIQNLTRHLLQETKVRVAPLRLRMNAIRQRAIGLMDEAFGPGAVDPQALSLQADALYGLEEQVSERSERALRKTSILAMNPAKWQLT